MAARASRAFATAAQGRLAILEVWNNRWFRRILRAGRIGVLSASIFGVGYSAGVSDVLADPVEFRRKKALTLLKSINATDEEGKVRLCDEMSVEYQAVRRVLPRLLRAAKAEVSHLEASPSADGTAETLRRARQRLEAWADDGFLLADVNSPNAFVTPVLPRVLFVHRGVFQVQRLQAPDTLEVGKEVYVHREGWQRAKLLADKGAAWNALLEDASEALVRQEEVRVLETRQLLENDEQLAMLIGHELAHAVHDHGYESFSILTAAYSLELVLLSVLDPSGMLIFLLELAAGAIARYTFVLPFSRCDELEADATGLRLCAMAGYDPRLAAKFMERFASFEGHTGPSWASTHPPTEARIRALNEAADGLVECFEQAKSIDSERKTAG